MTLEEAFIRSCNTVFAALGAAVGAAGLAGRLRPVDMLLPPTPVIEESERPWAIERVSPQLEHEEPVEIAALQILNVMEGYDVAGAGFGMVR